MKEKTVNGKRKNTLNEIDIAKMQVEYIYLQLKKNLEDIISSTVLLKKIKKVISSLTYLKLNWTSDDYSEEQLKVAEKRLREYSHLYEITILKRKILKMQLKQAQRKFSKKQESIIRFDKKYLNE